MYADCFIHSNVSSRNERHNGKVTLCFFCLHSGAVNVTRLLSIVTKKVLLQSSVTIVFIKLNTDVDQTVKAFRLCFKI